MKSILDTIDSPDQIKQLSLDQMHQLAGEIRETIIRTVATNGGHLASNLGVVELTLALLAAFEFPRDQVVFDVGHQAYAWKILTGRREQFCSLRRFGGLSGFPKMAESCYDCFNTGHSSTSISAALGLSRAMSHSNHTGHAIAVIGDGALTGGMAFEALNDAGQSGENLIVILNDNQMSIGRNVGGLSRHLENLRVSTPYLRIRSRLETFLSRVPLVGKPVLRLLNRFKQLTRMALQKQGIFFEQLGFRYYGPIDGHDLPNLIHHMQAIALLNGPILLHVVTQKGRGYKFAEESPDLYHGVAPFMVENGVDNGHAPAGTPSSFSEAFGWALTEMARHNSRICAISAAMTQGTGLSAFAASFPARFYDVGIAEQHAVTLAAGLAAGGMRPYVALYSTFLQRAYDQLLHDVCLQCLPVVIMVDRAGIVGEDGETHQGIYDLGLMLPMPGLEIYCPADYAGLRRTLAYSATSAGPVAIRYPRGRERQAGMPAPAEEPAGYTPGQPLIDGEQTLQKISCLRSGSHITLAALGTLAGPAMAAADRLAEQHIDAEVLSITCAKPLDMDSLVRSAARTGHIIILEEGVIQGGLGQNALPALVAALPDLKFRLLGLSDQPLCQGSRDQLLQAWQLDAGAIATAAQQLVN